MTTTTIISTVVTRSNKVESYNESAIMARLIELSGNFHGLGPLNVDPAKVVAKTKLSIFDNMKTSEIDSLAAKAASDLILDHPDYTKLAGRIVANNLHKQTPDTFLGSMQLLFKTVCDEYHKRKMIQGGIPKFIDEQFFKLVRINSVALNAMVEDSRDYLYTFTGYNQLKNIYLKKAAGVIFDRPQYLFLRVALALFSPKTSDGRFITAKLSTETLATVKLYYDLMSEGYYVHATPTLLNAGFSGQFVSCFLTTCDDAIESITTMGCKIAVISKSAGGVGSSYSSIRPKGSYIAGTNGLSTGIMPQLKIIESHAKSWNQGGARKGAVAIYLSDWHRDVIEFIEMRNKSGGDSEAKCFNLFNALWCHELFFVRLQEYYNLKLDGQHEQAKKIMIPLLDPSEYIGIEYKYGEELLDIWTSLEAAGRAHLVSVESYVLAIVEGFAQSGGPYICNGDAANACSNMQNYGAILSSNLCTEIFLPTRPDSYACCVLANIALNRFVVTGTAGQLTFDFDHLAYVTKKCIRALDRVIEVNKYPTPECEKNAFDLRPLGLGIQGLSDTFSLLGFSYLSPEAEQLDRMIFETMYYSALEESADIASELGSYPYFEGSHLSQGIFHWQAFENYTGRPYQHARKDLDWSALRSLVMQGVRNATFLALMPTESTSKIWNNSPCIEPWYQHWYANESDVNGRVELANVNVLYKAIELGLWTPENITKMRQTGTFPFEGHWASVYGSAYEMSVAQYMTRVHYRQYMVDQGISTNIRHKSFDEVTIIKQLLIGRELGLKTINYYVTIKPVVSTVKIDDQAVSKEDYEKAKMICSRDNREHCLMCL